MGVGEDNFANHLRARFKNYASEIDFPSHTILSQSRDLDNLLLGFLADRNEMGWLRFKPNVTYCQAIYIWKREGIRGAEIKVFRLGQL